MLKNTFEYLLEKEDRPISSKLETSPHWEFSIKLYPRYNESSFKGLSPNSPPMPFIIGPAALYDFGPTMTLKVKESSSKVHDFVINNNLEPLEIRLVFNKQLLEFYLNGELKSELKIETQQFNQIISIGKGYKERDWKGKIENLSIKSMSNESSKSLRLQLNSSNYSKHFDKHSFFTQVEITTKKNDNPLVSVITPSFNQVKFVKDSLYSVGQQEYKNIEHIIYDANSTDGTIDILNRYKKENQNVKLNIGKDSGHVDALNKGINDANGEIIAVLNTDDKYVNDTVVSRVVEIFTKNKDVDIVYGKGKYIDENGILLKNAFVHRASASLKYLMINSMGILHPAVFIRRSVIEKLGVFDESMDFSFDYAYWLKLVHGNAKFHFYDEDLAFASIHDEAKTISTRGTSLKEALESAEKFYGFAPIEWIERKLNHQFNGSDGILDVTKSEDDKKFIKQKLKSFKQRNKSKSSIENIIHYGLAKGGVKTAEFLFEQIINYQSYIVCASSASYFSQTLTLISSIQKNEIDNIPVFVFNLNLTDFQKSVLRDIRNVYVIEFAKYYKEFNDWYFDPKSYVYKIFAVHHMSKILPKNSNIIWIDAGVCPVVPLSPILNKVQKKGLFFIDHDDRPGFPFYNIMNTSDECIHAMSLGKKELLSNHLCSCLMGLKNEESYTKLFEMAFNYSLDANTSLGDKHPLPPVKKNSKSKEEYTKFREKELNSRDLHSFDLKKYRDVFGYWGHRQDQSIISNLVARLDAPVSSALKYCASTDRSSIASKLNWDARGFSDEIEEKIDALDEFPDSVTIHHRGTYINYNNISFSKKKNPAVIMGNGPSLGNFKLNKDFKSFDSFGMNAAYRLWYDINWFPKYYSCLDTVVGLSHKEAIEDLILNSDKYGIKYFLLRKNLIRELNASIPLEKVWDFDELRKGFSVFQVEPVTTGSHTCAWAVVLGYTNISILGVDCNYVEKVEGAILDEDNKLVIVEEKPNQNYFFQGYQQKGDKYNIPNPSKNLHIRSWRRIAEIIKDVGYDVDIYNSSKISKMDAFVFKPLLKEKN